MPTCNPVTNPLGCAAETFLRGALGQFVEMLKVAAEWMVALAFGWWIEVDSVLPSVANTPVRGELAWLAFAVVVAGLVAAGIRIIVARRADPAVDAVKGMVIVALVSATGLSLVRMLVRAGDEWAAQLLAAGVDGVGDEVIAALSLTSVTNPGVVFIMAIVIFVLSLAQAVLMLFREGAILILTGMLPLAAAGQLTGIGRQWFPKVTGWLLALVFYKPAAALVYFTVFQGLDTADTGNSATVICHANGNARIGSNSAASTATVSPWDRPHRPQP
ncbi:hypothetical protein KR546_11780, partial [Nitriliruptoria bacterium AS10]